MVKAALGMLGDIPLDNPSRRDVEHDEHLEDPKADGNRDEEITSECRLRVIAHEGGPALRGATAVGRSRVPEIPAQRARRAGYAVLQYTTNGAEHERPTVRPGLTS
jgi:hypothetical protein